MAKVKKVAPAKKKSTAKKTTTTTKKISQGSAERFLEVKTDHGIAPLKTGNGIAPLKKHNGIDKHNFSHK